MTDDCMVKVPFPLQAVLPPVKFQVPDTVLPLKTP